VRARNLAYGALNCMGRHTLTGLLTASGQQFVDWSSAYRLFNGNRMETNHLFSVIIKSLVEKDLNINKPIYAHMDDTLFKKTGKKVAGTSWRRDPLGPPFHTNFIWGQRFIQLSVSLPETEGASLSRAIPVDIHHCPTAKKPREKDNEEVWKNYKEEKKKTNLSLKGVERITVVRNEIDLQGGKEKKLVVSVDGSYTNEKVLKRLPERVTLIGRIRKDTVLNELPETKEGTGRRRVYGPRLPTPEQIRQSNDLAWQEVPAWAAGRIHNFNVKVIDRVRWRKAGEQNLKLVIIRPLAYRLTKKSRLLYRDPTYLICTDPNMDIEKLLQAYLWRWEIEVNFREEKTLLGCGQAQVRKECPVEKVPAFIVALYSLIHLAAYRVRVNGNHTCLPSTKWYSYKDKNRETTGDILNTFRAQVWTRAIDVNFNDFVNLQLDTRSRKNYANPTFSAAFYCRN
jgi:hypothetical protein